MTSQQPYYKMATLEKGITALELVSRFGPISVSGLAGKMGQGRSSVHRILLTLRDLGYVVQDETASYRLSLRLFDVGSRATGNTVIRDLAMPHLEKLARDCGETAYIGKLDGLDFLVIAAAEGGEILTCDVRLGQRFRAATMAAGRIANAFSDLMARQENNSAAKADEKKWAKIRKAGLIVADESWCPDLRSMAAPVLNALNTAVFAIGLSGPAMRMTPEKVSRISDRFKETARCLSRELSGRSGSNFRIKPAPM